jgi:hypothetical protein
MADTRNQHDEVREKFLKFLKGSAAVDGTRGSETAKFIPLDLLKEYLQTHIEELLEASSPPHESRIHHAPNILSSYSKVFAILLSINKGYYIFHFDQYDELTDVRLPFHNNKAFPLQEDFFQEFQQAQSKFCTPVLTCFHRQFSEDCILPFKRVGEPIQGNSGVISKIEVHASYDLLCSASKFQQVRPSLPFSREVLMLIRTVVRILIGSSKSSRMKRNF